MKRALINRVQIKMFFTTVLLVIFGSVLGNTLAETLQNEDSTIDYYWRDYNTKIPNDALQGGADLDGNSVYIGQAYIKNHYLQVVPIYPGNSQVTACHNGVHKTSLYVKILCSRNKNRFRWSLVDGNLAPFANKHLVRGGVEKGDIIYIGRVFYQGEVRIGKVRSYSAANATMYFAANNEEKSASIFEVLTFDV